MKITRYVDLIYGTVLMFVGLGSLLAVVLASGTIRLGQAIAIPLAAILALLGARAIAHRNDKK
jgi:hypothetical protein